VHDGVHCRGGRGAGGRRSPTPGQPAAWVGT
jgi:hypothetical protein